MIGRDRSTAMLTMADHRVAPSLWSSVTTEHADATDFSALDLGVAGVDAVIATYSLSVISQWQAAWECMNRVLRPGVVLGLLICNYRPVTQPCSVLLRVWPAGIGGSDIDAHPWHALRSAGHNLNDVTVRGGHIVFAAVTIS
ncbi:ubiquinone/menaquinone biosynthesis methyltransferase [Leifsonia rubra CMS 76R]|nr:ubiquinone/menaquinone biosynthesis methyltransferase [Leifsonia rubra CMS 76R]